MYRIAAYLARLSLKIGFFFGSRRFVWRFAPFFIDFRQSISRRNQYRIPQIVHIKAGGKNFRLAGNPWNSMAGGIYWGGLLGFEIMETSLVSSLCLEYDVALDIGANVGWFTLVMLSRNPVLHVYAFEPQPFVRSILKDNLVLNDFSATVEDQAVSEVDGAANFYVTREDCTSSLLEPTETTQTLIIRTVSIDSYVQQKGLVVDFIKMDVEGSELPALTGARQTLTNQMPDMLFEIQPKRTDVRALRKILSEAGYTTAWAIEGNHWAEDPDFLMSGGHTVINYFVSRKRRPPI